MFHRNVHNSKPLLLLIPGAWHSGDCYKPIAQRLQSSGYETLAVDLPSVGAEPPVTSLDPDIEHIRSVLLPRLEESRKVVVVMHSYSGVPGSSALYGLSAASRRASALPGAVVALVYLCSWMLPEGESIRSARDGRGGVGVSKDDGEGRLFHLDPVTAFYHDLPRDDASQRAKQLRHHSAATLHQPVSYAAHLDVPTTYLLCRNDRVISFDIQVELVERAGKHIRQVTCEAGHSPFLSHVDLTARVIVEAAEAAM